MPKHKKQRSHQVSKGERNSMSRKLTKAVASEVSIVHSYINKQKAWLAGKNPWITIDNPNVVEGNNINTNKRKIRIKANQLWGDPKNHYYSMYKEENKKVSSK